MKLIRAVSLLCGILGLSFLSTSYSSAMNTQETKICNNFMTDIVSGVVNSLEDENLTFTADSFIFDKYDCGVEGMKFNKVNIHEPVDDVYVYLPCVFGGYQYYGVDIVESVHNSSLVVSSDICTSEVEEWSIVNNRFYNSYLNCFAPYSLIEYTGNIDNDVLSDFKLLLRNEQLDFRYETDKEIKGYSYEDACDKFDDVYVEMTDDVEAYVFLEDFRGRWVYIEFDGESSVKNGYFVIKDMVYFEDIIIDSLSFYREDYYRDGIYIKSRYTGRVLDPSDIVVNEYCGRANSLNALKSKISFQFLKDFS